MLTMVRMTMMIVVLSLLFLEYLRSIVAVVFHYDWQSPTNVLHHVVPLILYENADLWRDCVALNFSNDHHYSCNTESVPCFRKIPIKWKIKQIINYYNTENFRYYQNWKNELNKKNIYVFTVTGTYQYHPLY